MRTAAAIFMMMFWIGLVGGSWNKLAVIDERLGCEVSWADYAFAAIFAPVLLGFTLIDADQQCWYPGLVE